ncbi:ABC-2 type transport system ATP-binding protein [Paenibacillus phyllosphaerae]|uniref:ABC-2 type transport system ATP-binding protein n=1 Tax=Paenibacillus phyllosphaerae TaxID=274593 RepID=A0A7W5B1J7_9BACL|nr:ATP-binding cassette domain-containing protein [Paenibacillus phyllosphaerae]MBB3112730.1 ABC-2 type transport system ATP-binding protein [Paenibacillus phyllosphaerae]
MIEVCGLTKTYLTHERGHTLKEMAVNVIKRPMKEVHAVKDISFTVETGGMVAFLGPNGAGKSTTLKMLTGVLHPTSGEATALGFTPWKNRREYVRRIGAVFGQKSQLLWDIPPIDSFYMNKAIYGVPDRAYKETLDHLTELLGVTTLIRKPTRQLSLGERMKCEFIMAMLHRPELVFLDEPTIGLDVIAKENIRDFIRSMNQQGVTFILTTHDLDDVELLARRVIVINHGELVFDDSISALRGQLGMRKAVRLSTEQPVAELHLPGVTLIKRHHDRELELEIDVELFPLKSFISHINEQYGILDMAMEPLPIETVMKQLYASEPRPGSFGAGSRIAASYR